ITHWEMSLRKKKITGKHCAGIEWPKTSRSAPVEAGQLASTKVESGWKGSLLCYRELLRRENQTTRTPAIPWQFVISTRRTSSAQHRAASHFLKTKRSASPMTSGRLMRVCNLFCRNGRQDS